MRVKYLPKGKYSYKEEKMTESITLAFDLIQEHWIIVLTLLIGGIFWLSYPPRP